MYSYVGAADSDGAMWRDAFTGALLALRSETKSKTDQRSVVADVVAVVVKFSHVCTAPGNVAL